MTTFWRRSWPIRSVDTGRSRGRLDGLQVKPTAVLPPSGVLGVGLESEADVILRPDRRPAGGRVSSTAPSQSGRSAAVIVKSIAVIDEPVSIRAVFITWRAPQAAGQILRRQVILLYRVAIETQTA